MFIPGNKISRYGNSYFKIHIGPFENGLEEGVNPKIFLLPYHILMLETMCLPEI